MKQPTDAQRKEWAKSGIAMPNGSYYIRNANDLDSAIKLSGVGNAATSAVKAHIIKRARALGLVDKLPDSWNVQHDVIGGVRLSHFGTKGMKWGVRKDKSSSSSEGEKSRGEKVAAAGKKHAANLLKQYGKQTINHVVNKAAQKTGEAIVKSILG